MRKAVHTARLDLGLRLRLQRRCAGIGLFAQNPTDGRTLR